MNDHCDNCGAELHSVEDFLSYFDQSICAKCLIELRAIAEENFNNTKPVQLAF